MYNTCRSAQPKNTAQLYANQLIEIFTGVRVSTFMDYIVALSKILLCKLRVHLF